MQIPLLPEPFQSILAYFTSTPINSGLTALLLVSLGWLLYIPNALGDDFTPPISEARQRLDTSSAYTALPLEHPKSTEFVTYTPKTLAIYDGTGGDDSVDGSRILLAINGRVFDVSSGKNFYGPGGPYGNFAGRDASRGMAKQSFDLAMLTPLDQPIDTLQDLTNGERKNMMEWESHFAGKYPIVGELVNEARFQTIQTD
ncbi:Dihydrodipicolinate synthase [Malassezia psittaci]|uniref:Dihydrodipicolinate synthase n=1 Tax=Malassezia psittaci TaxID=1821823 RepID=A0AAF0JL95_9BASI|nr:Dihydrodipicolinate synthase [Malassezia psittaci]